MITDIMREAFLNALQRVDDEERLSRGFTVLKEGDIHKAIKLYIEPDASKHEVVLPHAVLDILNDDGVYEVQTGSPLPLLTKLRALIPDYKVTLVLPYRALTAHRWLDTESGELTGPRRKASRPKGIVSLSRSLYAVRELIGEENFSIRVIGLVVEDTRALDGYGKDKKRRATLLSRRPTDIVLDEVFREKSDYLRIIPTILGDTFTEPEFVTAIKSRSRYDRMFLNLLVTLGVLERSEGEGRAYLYRKLP